jgi:transposase-like protein
MADHLGYDKHEPIGRNRGNSRNGKRTKTVLTDAAGEVDIEVPRDREGSFEPVIVRKRQRRLSDVDAVVLSLYAQGLTTGEISAHFAEVYGASVSKDTVSRITDRVDRGDADVVGQTPRGGVRGGVHRRDHGQDP